MINLAQQDDILAAHRTRVERVNRTRWQHETEVQTGQFKNGSRSMAARMRRQLGLVLIRVGEHLLPANPASVLTWSHSRLEREA
jgi:hypothetical protein